MNTENVQKLVEALRSGKYPQARGALRTEAGYCCLGVACDISGLGTWQADPQSPPDNIGHYLADRYVITEDKRDSDVSVLPFAVARWLDMEVGGSFEIDRPIDMDIRFEEEDRDYTRYHTLTELNDGDLTFEQIADILSNAEVFNWEPGPLPKEEVDADL